MTVQIVNTKLNRGNIIRTRKNQIFTKLRERGWNAIDCTFKEIPKEQLNTKYISADGKNITSTARR